jgi:hypothetical protein
VHCLRSILVSSFLLLPVVAAEPSIAHLARTAPVIFSGTVLAIEPREGAVLVTVSVDDGIKGAESGATLQFREWDGRWKNGAPYKVGDQFVFFLRAPSDAGLTSPLTTLRIRSGRVDVRRPSDRLGRATLPIPYAQFARRVRQSL